MTRLMYDSVNAKNIPPDARLVAGYVNGRYKWTDNDWKLFPNAQLVRIQVYIPGQFVVLGLGDVLDVEANDANTPGAKNASRQWVGSKMQQKATPCIYTSKATAKYLRYEGCDYWLADYTNAIHLVPGSVATQYKDAGPYDVSVCEDFWPRTNASPVLPPYMGGKYLFTPIRVSGTDDNGNAYWDVPNVDSNKVVNVVCNEQNPEGANYVKLPVFVGCLQVGGVCRLVFENGAPRLGAFDARLVTDPS